MVEVAICIDKVVEGMKGVVVGEEMYNDKAREKMVQVKFLHDKVEGVVYIYMVWES